MNKFRYQLRKFADRFVIFSLDIKTVLSELPSEIEWKYVADFDDETKAKKVFEKLS